MPYKDYFFPPLAGVAFSRNLYVWTDRIDPKKGMVRLVFGLGTAAVNRVGGDYPRMIAVSHPDLRPEFGPKVAKYSQHNLDVLDLKSNDFVTIPVTDILASGDYPNMFYLVSELKDNFIQDPFSIIINSPVQDLVLTFNNLVTKTRFVNVFSEMLDRLEKAYGYPLDTEFTAFVDAAGNIRLNLLQCRPMQIPGAAGKIEMPEKIAPERMLFRSGRMISGGVINNIQYIVYISPNRYQEIDDVSVKKSIGRMVGRINKHPRILSSKLLLMGPGRWGSNDLNLGVNAGYADIDNALALVEIGSDAAGHTPEVSYGTHYFQDLVESQIIYLPVFPDDPKDEFNREFFDSAPNILTELFPDAAKFDKIIKVIEVPRITDGMFAQIVADPQKQKAICFLANADEINS
jgi:pyruvate, water dikinase